MIHPGVIRVSTANIFYFILYIQKNIAGGIPMMNYLRIETVSFRGKEETYFGFYKFYMSMSSVNNAERLIT